MARQVTLNDNALTTLSNVERELDGYTKGSSDSEDDRIAGYINAGSRMLQEICGRNFYKATNHVERVAGHGDKQLLVHDHVPIDTVNSITYDDGDTTDTIDADDYHVINADEGQIRKINGVWQDTRLTDTIITSHAVAGTAQDIIKVDYDGGFVTQKQVDDGTFPDKTLPSDIEDAIDQYVVMRDAQQGSDQTVDSLSLGEGSVDFITYNGQRVAVPSTFKRIIARETDRSAMLF